MIFPSLFFAKRILWEKCPASFDKTAGIRVVGHFELFEHKLSEFTPSFVPENCEDRQLMDLIVRCHDLYVASPNSTQPIHDFKGRALAPCETKFCSAERAMSDRSVRAKKINEIWNQLSWLNEMQNLIRNIS